MLHEQGRILLALVNEPLHGLRQVGLTRHVRARCVGEEVLYPDVRDVRVAPRFVAQRRHRKPLEATPGLQALLLKPFWLLLERGKGLDRLPAYTFAVQNLRRFLLLHTTCLFSVRKGRVPIGARPPSIARFTPAPVNALVPKS